MISTENAGYGFDKIETNWGQYNNTAPEYDISFDGTILKLYTQKDKAETKTSGKLRGDFGETLEKLQETLKSDTVDKDLILNILNSDAEKYINALTSDFPKTSEKLLKGSSFNTVILLMLMDADITITAERASNILGVSSRTIETYIAKLKESQIIERQGSDKEGTWCITKE
ncbi:HTH domain-containing protein [Galbibacter mesophilus]|uniref:HTH domain-containing protein n=1 Tax=Galbibacter mesophilus TaxID=379069 RepID=UPI00191CD47D|nr:HTH domain-containing protein [Galbibacter mesophilus]MCM5661829.1 HTH domain-containing protein [Galbibacter mesophilus]